MRKTTIAKLGFGMCAILIALFACSCTREAAIKPNLKSSSDSLKVSMEAKPPVETGNGGGPK
jgi:hypothetical protein